MPGAATGGNSPQRVAQGRREAPVEGGRSFTPLPKTTADKALRKFDLTEPDSGFEGSGKAALGKKKTPKKAATAPVHTGGGWYLMPDGSKVRGKAAAGLE